MVSSFSLSGISASLDPARGRLLPFRAVPNSALCTLDSALKRARLPGVALDLVTAMVERAIVASKGNGGDCLLADSRARVVLARALPRKRARFAQGKLLG